MEVAGRNVHAANTNFRTGSKTRFQRLSELRVLRILAPGGEPGNYAVKMAGLSHRLLSSYPKSSSQQFGCRGQAPTTESAYDIWWKVSPGECGPENEPTWHGPAQTFQPGRVAQLEKFDRTRGAKGDYRYLPSASARQNECR